MIFQLVVLGNGNMNSGMDLRVVEAHFSNFQFCVSFCVELICFRILYNYLNIAKYRPKHLMQKYMYLESGLQLEDRMEIKNFTFNVSIKNRPTICMIIMRFSIMQSATLQNISQQQPTNKQKTMKKEFYQSYGQNKVLVKLCFIRISAAKPYFLPKKKQNKSRQRQQKMQRNDRESNMFTDKLSMIYIYT